MCRRNRNTGIVILPYSGYWAAAAQLAHPPPPPAGRAPGADAAAIGGAAGRDGGRHRGADPGGLCPSNRRGGAAASSARPAACWCFWVSLVDYLRPLSITRVLAIFTDFHVWAAIIYFLTRGITCKITDNQFSSELINLC